MVFSYQGLKSFTGIDNIERALKTFAQKTEFQTLVQMVSTVVIIFKIK